jgi:hypothetical protein
MSKVSACLVSLVLMIMTPAAFATGRLDCSVKKFSKIQGEVDCGKFSFRLPKDNDEGVGRGKCSELKLWVSWFGDQADYESALTLVFGMKNGIATEFADMQFAAGFPKKFHSKNSSKNAIWYTDCEVVNEF